MADNTEDPLIAKALVQIEEHTKALRRLRAFVNDADRLNGNPPRFANDEADPALVGVLADAMLTTYAGAQRAKQKKWAPGAFFNKSFTAAVRQVLAGRYEASGEPSPASVDEIHDALTQGSFDFEATGAESQKNAIRISLGKNSLTFVKLPNTDLFGLVEWYGPKPRKPGRKASANGTPTPADAQAGEDEAAAEEAAAETETEENKGG